MDSSQVAAARRGYPDYEVRIPDGWRVVHTDAWPINTTFGPEKELNIDTWRFETYGEVGRRLALSYEEFNHLPQSTIIADHHCSDGWSYLGHEWTGVTLKEIARKTAASQSVGFILIECDRGLTQCFPIEQDVLFATKRNGSPLLREGGFPLRAVAPGEYGYKSVKWVNKVKFMQEREPDFYDRGLLRWGMDPIPPEENPWNCDNARRKKTLRKIFSKQLEEERQRRVDERLGACNHTE